MSLLQDELLQLPYPTLPYPTLLCTVVFKNCICSRFFISNYHVIYGVSQRNVSFQNVCRCLHVEEVGRKTGEMF